MTVTTKNPRQMYWWPEQGKLVFLEEVANPQFWDKRWRTEDWKKQTTRGRKGRFWRSILEKYLSDTHARILEGGCGDGHLVDAMKFWGYRAIGVDYAAATVQKINQVVPDLDVREGDVRKLEFEDEYFDGYWSLGVIEHFWEGYDSIVVEMNRVLRTGGYAFVIFPCVSRLDRVQILLGGYRRFRGKEMPCSFYQFGLDPASVKHDFCDNGFDFVTARYLHGVRGLEHGLPRLYRLTKVLERRRQGNRLLGVLYFFLGLVLAPLCGHTVLLVLKKRVSCKATQPVCSAE